MSGAEGRIYPVEVNRERSRRNFLKTAGWATAAIGAAGIGGFGVAARYVGAQEGDGKPYESYQGLGDVAILQFAYLLEQLEGVFYQTGADAGIFDEFGVAQIAAIRDHEIAHAEAIAATLGTLGAEVPATPEFTYPDGVFSDPAAFLELAATFEPVGIGAYQGAAPALESKEILAAAISIHNSECQHRCAINILSGNLPPNDLAFEEALPLSEVQQAVEPFGITG
jgi:hypothetical protein